MKKDEVNIKIPKVKEKISLMECPFCGGEAMLHDIKGDIYKTNGMKKEVLKNKRVKTFCRCGVCRVTTDTYNTAWEAVCAWNNRV